MNISDNNKFQLIDDFLNGGMNKDEMDKFKAFMQSDKDMTIDVNITSELGEAAAFQSAETQLRTTLSNIRKERVTTNKTDTNKKSFYGKLVLLALVLGGLTYLLINLVDPWAKTSANQPTNFAMVEQLALVSKSDDNAKNILQLEALYNKGAYAEALPYIKAYLAENPKDLDVLLAKGVALTETQQFKEAHLVFARIAAMKPRVQKHRWFDAVAYAKEGKTEQARSILHNILKDKTYNHEHAKGLLARLN